MSCTENEFQSAYKNIYMSEGRFLCLSRAMRETEAYRTLSPTSKLLLIDILDVINEIGYGKNYQNLIDKGFNFTISHTTLDINERTFYRSINDICKRGWITKTSLKNKFGSTVFKVSSNWKTYKDRMNEDETKKLENSSQYRITLSKRNENKKKNLNAIIKQPYIQDDSILGTLIHKFINHHDPISVKMYTERMGGIWAVKEELKNHPQKAKKFELAKKEWEEWVREEIKNKAMKNPIQKQISKEPVQIITPEIKVDVVKEIPMKITNVEIPLNEENELIETNRLENKNNQYFQLPEEDLSEALDAMFNSIKDN